MATAFLNNICSFRDCPFRNLTALVLPPVNPTRSYVAMSRDRLVVFVLSASMRRLSAAAICNVKSFDKRPVQSAPHIALVSFVRLDPLALTRDLVS
jgi:hypothetical protein